MGQPSDPGSETSAKLDHTLKAYGRLERRFGEVTREAKALEARAEQAEKDRDERPVPCERHTPSLDPKLRCPYCWIEALEAKLDAAERSAVPTATVNAEKVLRARGLAMGLRDWKHGRRSAASVEEIAAEIVDLLAEHPRPGDGE